MDKKLERRAYVADELRIDTEEGQALKIHGHAAVFDTLSEDLGGFFERIAPAAFARTIQSGDVRALFNHNPDYVLGRNKAGTLKLTEDSKGLAIEIDPPDTQFARDLLVSMARGDINQMSFGFRTLNDKWQKVDGEWIRTLLEVELVDISPVTFPAYPQTDVAVRSLEVAQAEERIANRWKLKLSKRRLSLLEL